MHEDMKKDAGYSATLNLIEYHGYSEGAAFKILANYYFLCLKDFEEQAALDAAKESEESVPVDVNQVILKELCKAVAERDNESIDYLSRAYQRIQH